MYDWDRKVDWNKQLYFEEVEVGNEVVGSSIVTFPVCGNSTIETSPAVLVGAVAA